MATSYETGVKVAQWTTEMKVNPEELGHYLEGDIMLTNMTKRNGATDQSLRWLMRIVPYVISGSFTDAQLKLINDAMKDYQTYTCIRFRRRTNEKDYINILSDNTGCWSNIDRIGGKQVVNLQTPSCVRKKGTVIHEFMHACGFWHEHTRENRDTYVSILWNNIEKSARNNFVKVAPGETYAYGVRYDYGSVMHYLAYAFSSNNQKTIETKDPNARIGQREGFSNLDVLKINRMYECSS